MQRHDSYTEDFIICEFWEYKGCQLIILTYCSFSDLKKVSTSQPLLYAICGLLLRMKETATPKLNKLTGNLWPA